MIQNKSLKQRLTQFVVPLMFITIIAISIPISGYSPSYLVNQVVLRMARNSFLVLALLPPIQAGLGINFGLVLGAIAGQIGIIFANDWDLIGVNALYVAILVSLPVAMLLGWFAGQVMNRAKGREMITSMMLSFFISGIYLAFVLFVCGSIIPFKNQDTMILSRGYGVRNSFMIKAANGFDYYLDRITGVDITIGETHIPLYTFVLIGLCCLFIRWFNKTKIGQEMRACGQSQVVSDSAGIKVNKIRVQAMMLSTVLAAIGQIIYLQNLGTLNTYNGADQAALFAAAALLIGGATVSKATIPNALVGTALFHLLFIVMPRAGKNLTGSTLLGEYFRTFVSYGIVTITLVLHAWRRQKDKELELEQLRESSKKSAEKSKA